MATTTYILDESYHMHIPVGGIPGRIITPFATDVSRVGVRYGNDILADGV